MPDRNVAGVSALIAAASLVAGPAAHAADLTADASNIVATFAKASGGDKVTLTGEFPNVVVIYAPGRTYKPALQVNATRANFTAIILNGLSGVHWTGGQFRGARGRPGVTIGGNGRDVTFDNIEFRGDGVESGFLIRNMTDVALTNSRFERPRVGVGLVDVANAKVIGNAVWGWSADAYGISGSSHVEIRKNLCAVPMPIDKELPPEKRIHVDCFQGYSAWPRPNVNVVLADNLVFGFETQGIWFNAIEPYAPPTGIVAEGNTVVTGTAPNGVVVDGPTNVARNNRVMTLDGSRWITMWKTVRGATGCGNIAEAYGGWKAFTDPPCKGGR